MEAQQAAQRQTIEAEAKAKVLRIDADAAAYSTRVKAEAEAEANRKIAESLTPEFIQFTQIQQWTGELPEYVSGSAAEALPVLSLNGNQAGAD